VESRSDYFRVVGNPEVTFDLTKVGGQVRINEAYATVVIFVAVQSNREPCKTKAKSHDWQQVLNQSVENNNFQQVSETAQNGLKSHCAEQRTSITFNNFQQASTRNDKLMPDGCFLEF
jgi:hypothetical protein